MKTTPPMTRYRDNINKLKAKLTSLYNTTSLNKARSKGSYWNETHKVGVQQDHVLLFHPKFAETEYTTFAFCYDYIGKPPEKHKVQVTIKPKNINRNKHHYDFNKQEFDEINKKLNGQIISSQSIPVEIFNEQLKAFISLLGKIKNPTESQVLDAISSIFHGAVINIDQQTNEAQKQLSSLIAEMVEREKELTADFESKILKIAEAKSKASGALKRTKEYREREALKIRLLELDKIIAEKENENLDKFEINTLTREKNAIGLDLKAQKKLIEDTKIEFISEQNPLIRKKIKF